LDVYHTSTHGVALMRIWNAGLKCAARSSREIQDAKMTQKNRHRRPIAQLCRAESSQLRHASTIGKKLNSNISSVCPNNMANFGPLAAEINSGVWGTPGNFNGVSHLAFVTAATSFIGGQPNFARYFAASWLLHYIHFRGLLPPDGISPRAKFTLRPSLAFSYIGSVTARHSSSGVSQTASCMVQGMELRNFRRRRHVYSALWQTRWAPAHILVIIMAALCNRTSHYILPCGFFYLSSFFPRLISAVADWMSTIFPHKVWP